MKNGELSIKAYAITLDCRDHCALADFYCRLLGWQLVFQDEEYACIAAPGTQQCEYPCINFQKNPDYLPPVWPEQRERQQQMAHLDLAVNDLDAAVDYAVQCGATVAPEQFERGWTVMFDPQGHPFCLVIMRPIMDSPAFALK